VEAVNISPFLSNLPRGKGTRCFSTPDASGSTSQAAAIQEALEAGARTLLVDEDTTATNFMIRDARMLELVSGAREPITPFLSRLPALAARGLSCILVIGGSGQYFDVAGAQRCQSHSPACLFGRRFQESPAWRCRVPAACCATLPPSCCDSLPRSPV
jgi:predicted ABC-class ATPase